MKRHALYLLFLAAALPCRDAGAQANQNPAPGQKGHAAATPGADLAEKAIEAAQKDNLEEAVTLFRRAYELDGNARWLYDLGVLHDKLGECDDAAFFYRAALWGKGILPQDQDPVDNRLGVLEDECHFKKRHATAVDRHARAQRYAGYGMCKLAEGILTGIITPAEKKLIEDCRAKK